MKNLLKISFVILFLSLSVDLFGQNSGPRIIFSIEAKDGYESDFLNLHEPFLDGDEDWQSTASRATRIRVEATAISQESLKINNVSIDYGTRQVTMSNPYIPHEFVNSLDDDRERDESDRRYTYRFETNFIINIPEIPAPERQIRAQLNQVDEELFSSLRNIRGYSLSNSIPEHEIIQNRVIIDLARVGYGYSLENVKIYYRNPDGEIEEHTIPGRDVFNELNNTDQENNLWMQHFDTIGSDRISILTRDDIRVQNTKSYPGLQLGLDGLKLRTSLLNQDFEFSFLNGDPERNYPNFLGGGFNYQIQWMPNRSFPLLGYFQTIGVIVYNFDNFTYTATRDIEDLWSRIFLGGDVFKFQEYPNNPRRLSVNRFELNFMSRDLREIFSPVSETTNSTAIYLSANIHLPFELSRSETVDDGRTLLSNGETISAHYTSRGFNSVPDGRYLFTRDRIEAGLAVIFQPNQSFIQLTSGIGSFYLRDLAIKLSNENVYAENVYVDNGSLFYGNLESYISFMPELSFAFTRKPNVPHTDLFSLNIRGSFGGINDSVMFTNHIKITDNIDWITRLVLLKDASYNSVFITGPSINLFIR